MKIHKTHIWLSILLISAFFVLGSTSALAIERYCTSDQKALGTCLEIKNYLGEIVYIVKKVTLDGGEPLDDATPGVNWPTIGGAYTYWGGASDGTREGTVLKPSAWSYIVFDLAEVPINADPSGAQLALDSFACGDATIDPGRVAYKLNPSVNTTNDAIFTLYYPEDTIYDACSDKDKVYVLFKKECSGGLISPTQPPYVEKRRFECSPTIAMLVKYDRCTGEPLKVDYEVGGEGKLPIEEDITPFKKPWLSMYVAVPESSSGWRLDALINMGPAQGTVLCTDDDLPVFLWSDRGYFSKYPDGIIPE